MQRYGTVQRALMLAGLAVGGLACEDHPTMPLEPTEEPRLLTAGDGWTTIDGIEFYESGGNLYPRSGVTAEIWDPKTTGDIWPRGGSIIASFDFRGSGATQSTTWELTRLSSGEHLAGSKTANYGSASGGVTTVVRRTYRGSFAIVHSYECDLRLTAQSDHSAWWMGVTIEASPPYIKLGTWGLKPAFSKMTDRVRECGATEDFEGDLGGDGGRDSGGDGGGDGDESDEPEPQTCTDCQQWLHFSTSGEYMYDDWECKEISWAKCEELMS